MDPVDFYVYPFKALYENYILEQTSYRTEAMWFSFMYYGLELDVFWKARFWQVSMDP